MRKGKVIIVYLLFYIKYTFKFSITSTLVIDSHLLEARNRLGRMEGLSMTIKQNINVFNFDNLQLVEKTSEIKR